MATEDHLAECELATPHIRAAPLSGCSAGCGCFYLVRLLGGSGAILERDEAGVEDFGVD